MWLCGRLRVYLRLVLAFLWLVDAVLQTQPYMWTRGFARDVIDGSASGNPHWLVVLVDWVGRLVASHPVWWNALFAITQLAIAVLIACRPTLRWGLGLSIVWGLGVWVVGEGLGGVLTGHASPWTGAPGSALLYVVASVLLWPRKGSGHGAPAAPGEGVTGWVPLRRCDRVMWCALWGVLALLAVLPANRKPSAMHDMLNGVGDGQPKWIYRLIQHVAEVSNGHGEVVAIATGVILIVVAGCAWAGVTAVRAAVVLAVLMSGVFWVVGQGCGQLYGGQATDPNSGPVLALIALTCWPMAARRAGTRIRQ